jgi:4-hydroxybenzoate polyprenyltransferase
MTALQVSIGALNDLHDAPDDAGRKPGKPIPAGLVSVPTARAIVAGGAVLGVALAALADLRIGALAVVVLGIGYGYDVAAKGTAWSWLPFAVGIPILPVYGWLGAPGDLPSFFTALIPMTVLAGAALAIANARADLERDVSAGTESVATWLGLEGSWRVHGALWASTLVVGLAWLAFRGVGLIEAAPVVVAAGLIGAAVAWSRGGGPAHRERAWQFEAVFAAVTLGGWVLALTRGS